MSNKKKLIILGIRGVPASHGGFETFAEYLCNHLIASGWAVTVYCQEDGTGSTYESEWCGVKRIHIPVNNSGPFGTIIFDLKSVLHSLRHEGVFLTLGYNTAVFNIFHRLTGKKNIINMDGIEWKRQKWGGIAKTWFWLNERFGCWFGNHLIADHPGIEDHLATRVSRNKITMIPYGGREIIEADERILQEYGLVRDKYAIIIARPEPENSILELVEVFSSKKRNAKLVLLGDYSPEKNEYHKSVMAVASSEVIFTGAIYESEKIGPLRFFTRFYVHGHQVGGTNPSLVEALGASNAILAHDNEFNRWVAKGSAIYFSDDASIDSAIDELFNNDVLIDELKLASVENYRKNFKWPDILQQYEEVLSNWYEKS